MYLVAKARPAVAGKDEDGSGFPKEALWYLCARDVEVDELIELVLPRRSRDAHDTARNTVKNMVNPNNKRHSIYFPTRFRHEI